MPARSALRWLEARGWLVLAGSAGGSDAIVARALSIAAADGAVAVLAGIGEDGVADRLLDNFEGLGAQSGYLVDATVEDDETLHSLLTGAGIVVVSGAADAGQAQAALSGATSAGMRQAWQQGALVLLEGPAAMCAGEWILRAAGQCERGLAWLPGALVLPGVAEAGDSEAARVLLGEMPAAVALGIGQNAALALGPGGELELWGEAQVSIALGAAWRGLEEAGED